MSEHTELPPLHPLPEKKPLYKKALAFAAAAISVVMLLNPGWGVIEVIPDNIPGIGNLDELFFTGLLFYSLDYLGIRIPFLSERFARNADKKREGSGQKHPS